MAIDNYTSPIIKWTGAQNQTEFTYPFQSYEADDVIVYVWSSSDGKYIKQTQGTDYTQVHTTSDRKIIFNTSPATSGDPLIHNVIILRKTDLGKAKSTPQAGSAIKAQDLINNQDQTLKSLQEIALFDQINPEVFGSLNMHGHVPYNSGTPTVDGDVVNKKYVDGLIAGFNYAGASAPTEAKAGDRWYDTVSGRTYIKYDDGDPSGSSNSIQWVDSNPPFSTGAGGTAPANALDKTGDTMTGDLNLFAHPVSGDSDLQAATKKYVDDHTIADGNKTDITVSGNSWTLNQDSVDSAEIKENAVGSSELANNSVDTDAIVNNAVNGTKIALGGDVQGDLMYYNGTDYARLAPGQSGQYLQTKGENNNPIWATVSSSGGATNIVNSNVASNADIDASKLKFTSSWANSVGRTLNATDGSGKLQDVRSVKDFGAKGDGTTNDTTAIKNALEITATTPGDVALYFPKGTYIIQETLVLENRNIHIYGDGPKLTILRWSSGNTGIEWRGTNDANANDQLKIRNICLQAEGHRSAYALEAKITKDSGVVTQNVNLDCVTAGKKDENSSWKAGFYFKNCRTSTISNCVFNGRWTSTTTAVGTNDSTYGFLFDGADSDSNPLTGAGCNDTVVENCYVNNAAAAFRVEGISEGIKIINCTAIGINSGVEAVFTKGEPYLTVMGCHFNSKVHGVVTENSIQGLIQGNLFYVDGDSTLINSSNNPQTWIGVNVAGTTSGGLSPDDNSNNYIISGNICHGLEDPAGSSGTAYGGSRLLIGVQLKDGQFYTVNGNHFYLLDEGVRVHGGSNQTDKIWCVDNTYFKVEDRTKSDQGGSASPSFFHAYPSANYHAYILENGNTNNALQLQLKSGDDFMNIGTLSEGNGDVVTNNNLSLKAGETLAGKILNLEAPTSGGKVKIQASNTGNGSDGGQIEFWTSNGTDNIQKATYTKDGRFLWRWTTPGNTLEFPRHEVWGGPAPSLGCFNNQNDTTQRNQILFFNDNGDSTSGRNGYGIVGSITANNSSTVYNTSSDYRLKENVVPLTGAIARVKALTPYRFNFKVSPDVTVDGFMAHEAQTVVPEAVTGVKDGTKDIGTIKDENGKVLHTNIGEPPEQDEGHTWEKTGTTPDYQGIDQAKLVPLLTAALQEALTEIDNLKTRVTTLEAG